MRARIAGHEEPLLRALAETAAYLLQEIAGREGDGGADAETLPRLIERRRDVALGGDELEEALALLESRGLIVRVADRYVLSASMRRRAPKEPDGTITMSRQPWIRLFGSLGLTESGA